MYKKKTSVALCFHYILYPLKRKHMRKLLSQKILLFSTITTLAGIFIIACSKNSKTELSEKEKEQEISIKESNRSVTFSMPEHCPGLENPCSDPACAPYFSCDEEIPEVSITSAQNSYNLNDMTSSFQGLQVNLAQLSSELGLSYTLSSNHIDFQNISRSYVTNDGEAGEALVAPFKSNSSSNSINYAFFITVDSDSIYRPFIIKATTNQSLKYFDLDQGRILTVNNYNNSTVTFQNTTGSYMNLNPEFTANRVAGCGQATMDCVTDVYSNHGWGSVWATVQSIFIPATGAAIVGACAVKNCIPRRVRSIVQ